MVGPQTVGGEFLTWTAAVMALSALIGMAVFWLNRGKAEERANNRADAAQTMAEEAKRRADEAHVSLGLVTANISLLREKVAGEYPDHEAMEAMERRLIAEIHRLSDRLNQVLADRHSSRS